MLQIAHFSPPPSRRRDSSQPLPTPLALLASYFTPSIQYSQRQDIYCQRRWRRSLGKLEWGEFVLRVK